MFVVNPTGFLLLLLMCIWIPCIEGECPSPGWRQWEGSWYIFMGRTLRNFDEAGRMCREYGAELVSIHSQVENNIVKDMCNSDPYPDGPNCLSSPFLWIGLNRIDSQWADGSPVSWTFWGRQKSVKDYCAAMYLAGPFRGNWYLRPCLERNYTYVCKRAAIVSALPNNSTAPALQPKVEEDDPPEMFSTSEMSAWIVAGIAVCCLIASVLVGIIVFKKRDTKSEAHDDAEIMGHPGPPYPDTSSSSTTEVPGLSSVEVNEYEILHHGNRVSGESYTKLGAEVTPSYGSVNNQHSIVTTTDSYTEIPEGAITNPCDMKSRDVGACSSTKEDKPEKAKIKKLVRWFDEGTDSESFNKSDDNTSANYERLSKYEENSRSTDSYLELFDEKNEAQTGKREDIDKTEDNLYEGLNFNP